jgi:hypothetical protein
MSDRLRPSRPSAEPAARHETTPRSARPSARECCGEPPDPSGHRHGPVDRAVRRSDRAGPLRHPGLQGASPLVERPSVKNTAENINYLSAAFRTDADEVGRTVRRATDTANSIIDSARDRTAEINGLLEVVQEEAESTFLNTASLLRGVRATRPRRVRDEDDSERRRRLG